MREYLEIVGKIYAEIEAEESSRINEVADRMSQSIIDGHIVHIFGTGHSEMVCKEVFTRAGSLSCFRIIGVHYDLEKFERLEGMAAIFMADYEIKHGEIVFVISSSGINAMPIEVAMLAKEKGAFVIAFTSLSHSKLVQPRHPSGKKLYQIADLVIDTHVPAGDAAVQLPGLPMKAGPVSSLANIMIINTIVIETTRRILEKGEMPPIRISRNMPGGDEHNQRFKELYSKRIPELKL